MTHKVPRIITGGLSGTGKGATTKTLLNMLRHAYPKMQLVSGGERMRKFAKDEDTTVDDPAFQARILADPNYDMTVDGWIKELVQDPESGPIIVECHLGNAFDREARTCLSVLLQCDDKVRYERIFQRDKAKEGYTSVADAEETTKKRDEANRIRYKERYGITDYLDPKYYDLTILTTHIQPVEVVGKIIIALDRWQKGLPIS